MLLIPARTLLQDAYVNQLHILWMLVCRVLERWLCEGVVHDPYGEFMVQEHKVTPPFPILPAALSQFAHHSSKHQPLALMTWALCVQKASSMILLRF